MKAWHKFHHFPLTFATTSVDRYYDPIFSCYQNSADIFLIIHFVKSGLKPLKLMICIPCSMGKYVCHHAILTRDHGYYVGARRFSTIGAVVDYFKDNPLGETFLKQEVR